MTYRPYPFTWVPAAYQRHASLDPLPEDRSVYPNGEEVVALCGQTLSAVTGEFAWLWLTCSDCDAKAHEIAGLPRGGGRC